MSGRNLREGLDNSRPFRPWLDSSSDQIESLVERVYGEIAGSVLIRQKPKLARRHLKSVLLNLLTVAARDCTRYCAYSRTRNTYAAKSRYNPLDISPGVIEVVDALAEAGLIEHHRGIFYRDIGFGRVSRMKPTDKLLAMVEIDPAQLPALLACPPNLECIKLYPAKVGGKRGNALEYEDTDETHRMRGVLTAYNALLEQTDIRLNMDAADVRLRDNGPDEWALNPASKRLYRIFNDGRWDHGGRFYGGWWESLPSELRARILINGMPVAEPDYRAIHIKLLYGLQGTDYDQEIGGDPYQLDGWEQTDQLRNILKQAILIAVNAANFESGLRAVTGKLSHDPEKYGWDFSEKGRLRRLLQAMIDKHEPIAHSLFNGQGKCLQYLDSQITELLLSRFMEEGIAILPVHDSYIVDERFESFLDQEMDRCFWKVIGASRDREENRDVSYIEGLGMVRI